VQLLLMFREKDICVAETVEGCASPVIAVFHPRRQTWTNHFRLDDATVVPITPEGRATTFLLKFNLAGRLTARQLLFSLGYYP
jgi:hypothetical protein